MAVVTMRQMLDAGVHFGHQTSRWNPKMKRFIFTERNGIYIIDLQQSLAKIDEAFAYIRDTVAHGGTVLFVGTKRQAQEAVAEQAARVGMPYVNERWLGGMLTNFQTVSKRVSRLKELEEIDFDDVAGSGRTKKELLMMRREKDKLAKSLGGIRDMARTPSVVWIVDTNKEHLAVEEATKLGIPVVGILDSNCDPDKVQYGIPGNDDAIRAVGLLTRVVADAVAEGLKQRAAAATQKDGSDDAAAEPLAEWEQELLDGADSSAADGKAADAKADDAKADTAEAADAADDKPAKKASAKKADAKDTSAGESDEKPAKKPAAKKTTTTKKAPAKKAAEADDK
jgi:small subunit ribosomal protein S2